MSYKFVIEGSDLFYLEKDKLSDNMVKRLVITKDKLSTVLKMCHISSGHQGINKTVNKINERYYWKGIVENTRKFVKQCEICQETKQKSKNYSSRIKFCFHWPKSLGKNRN
jgi:hypothetical protein